MQSLNSALMEPIEEASEVPLLRLEEAKNLLTRCLHVYHGVIEMPTTSKTFSESPKASFAETVARTHHEVIFSRSSNNKKHDLYALIPESATHPLAELAIKADMRTRQPSAR